MYKNVYILEVNFIGGGIRSTQRKRPTCLKSMTNSGIKGKILTVVYNMYDKIQSCVQYNGEQSEFFPCLTPRKCMSETGRKLTNFLFSVFLTDLENFLSESNISPLEQIQEKSFQELNTLFKVFLILYAKNI